MSEINNKKNNIEKAKNEFCNDSNNWQGTSREDLKLGWDACLNYLKENNIRILDNQDLLLLIRAFSFDWLYNYTEGKTQYEFVEEWLNNLNMNSKTNLK